MNNIPQNTDKTRFDHVKDGIIDLNNRASNILQGMQNVSLRLFGSLVPGVEEKDARPTEPIVRGKIADIANGLDDLSSAVSKLEIVCKYFDMSI